jgi:hypothetical protein
MKRLNDIKQLEGQTIEVADYIRNIDDNALIFLQTELDEYVIIDPISQEPMEKEYITANVLNIDDMYDIGLITEEEYDDDIFIYDIVDDVVDMSESDLIRLKNILNKRFPND